MREYTTKEVSHKTAAKQMIKKTQSKITPRVRVANALDMGSISCSRSCERECSVGRCRVLDVRQITAGKVHVFLHFDPKLKTQAICQRRPW